MDPLLPVLGASMRPIIERLQHYARTEETILLAGPTGVGKTHLARLCHACSPRRGGPLESLHLQSVPEPLQLGELFGWRRGAFTGAARDLPGHVTRAHGGTLFIDEIDKLSLAAQAALLWLIDERRYRPLGENAHARSADVRILVATNADLTARVAQGLFREDLYYRIHVLPVLVPALSQRREEIAEWAMYFLRRHHERNQPHPQGPQPHLALTATASAYLRTLPWPGNLRQLDNIVRRAAALAGMEATGTAALQVELHHIEAALALEPAASATLGHTLEQAATAFVRACEHHRGIRDGLGLCGAGFRGLVLDAALKHCGDEEAALALLGMQHWRRSRNGRRLIQREAERRTRLLAVFTGAQEQAKADVAAASRRKRTTP